LVRELRAYQVTPHIARKVHSAIDRRTTRHAGYASSQIKRKRVEEIFGWMKTVAGLRKTRHRGADRVGWMFTFRFWCSLQVAIGKRLRILTRL